MIRQPTPPSTLYAWWRAAIRGENPPRHDGEPHCGFYQTKLVKGGPLVPVQITCERDIDQETRELASDEVLVALVDGQRRDPVKIWTFLTPISREDFLALEDRRRSIPAMAATLAPIDISRKAMTP